MESIRVFGVILAMDSTAEADHIVTLKLLETMESLRLILVLASCHCYNIASQIESSARLLVLGEVLNYSH